MLVLSECYHQRLEEKSIASPFAFNISPKTFKHENKQKSLHKIKLSVKDFFRKCEPADLVTFAEEILNEKLHLLCSECIQFLETLNKQDSSIRYTTEFDND